MLTGVIVKFIGRDCSLESQEGLKLQYPDEIDALAVMLSR